MKHAITSFILLLYCNIGIYLCNNQNASSVILLYKWYKKYGRKAKTIFKTGLDFITKYFLNDSYKPDFDIFEFLSCT
jgi:hypothetical protein